MSNRLDTIEQLISRYKKGESLTVDEKTEMVVELLGLPINTKIETLDRSLEICLDHVLKHDKAL